jgi:hypothetical protein
LKQNHFPFTRTKLRIQFTTVTIDAEDNALRDVMREEKSRGKRRIDPEEQRKRQELLRGFRDALQARTEREFLDAIKLLGLGDDPQKREKALKIWRPFSR